MFSAISDPIVALKVHHSNELLLMRHCFNWSGSMCFTCWLWNTCFYPLFWSQSLLVRLERLEKQKRADRGSLRDATASARSNKAVFARRAQRRGFAQGQLPLLRLTPLKSKRHHTKITSVSTCFETRFEEWKFSYRLNGWLTKRCECDMFHSGVMGPCLDPSFHSSLPFFASEEQQTQCGGWSRALDGGQQGMGGYSWAWQAVRAPLPEGL